MEKFIISANNGYMEFLYTEVIDFPERTSPFGGYDVWGHIEIKCDNYFVKGNLAFSTGEVYEFFTQLIKIEQSLKGMAKFDSFENQLSFLLSVDKLGHFSLKGEYEENLLNNTKLFYELKGDQTFLTKCIVENKKIIEKYGDKMGVNKNAL